METSSAKVVKKPKLVKKENIVKIKVITQFEICGEITLKLSNGMMYYISPDGISIHPSENQFKQCLADHHLMQNAFCYKRSQQFSEIKRRVLRLEGLNENYVSQIKNYFGE